MVDQPEPAAQPAAPRPTGTGTGPSPSPSPSTSPSTGPRGAGGARMDDVAQVHQALGRYPPGRSDRVLYSALGLVFLVPGVLGLTAGNLWSLPALVAGALFLLLGWVVPATIVTRDGFRRGRYLRRSAWSDVTTVYPPPRGGDVQVRLRDERVVRLDGVKAGRLTGIVLLAHAATPPTLPPATRPDRA